MYIGNQNDLPRLLEGLYESSESAEGSRNRESGRSQLSRLVFQLDFIHLHLGHNLLHRFTVILSTRLGAISGSVCFSRSYAAYVDQT